MKVIIMRHGYAESPSYRSDDFFRALTIEGNQLAYKAARGLLTIIPHLDRIVTSPIKRARQTAEIFGEVYQFVPNEITSRSFLADSDVIQYFDKIRNLPGEVILFVGHLPTVSQFVELALPATQSRLSFDPTTVVILEFKAGALPRKAVLRGHYTCEQLVMLMPSTNESDRVAE